MAENTSFRDLDAWQAAATAVELTYRLTADFPDSERFGLSSQMRRAAVSMPSNVAEAQAVRSTRWSVRHIVIAIGSSCELETQLHLAVRLAFVTAGAARDLQIALDRTQKLLYGLRREKERRLLGSGGAIALALAFVILRFLAPRASRLAPRASRLAPRASRLA